MTSNILINRRSTFRMAFGAIALGFSGESLSAILATPDQAEGPFYPLANDRFLDTDNDLVKREQETKEAGGQILYLTGAVLTLKGEPVSNARVEIWQCDVNGRYIHPGDESQGFKKDVFFQGFGSTTTSGSGQYHFRTIKPVAYGSRTPHIHFKIFNQQGQEMLTTQLYFQDEPMNQSDGLYRRLSEKEKSRVTVKLDEIKNQELLSQFDIFLA